MSKWLPVQIALGVGWGIVFGCVAVYKLAMWELRDELEALAGGRSVLRLGSLPERVVPDRVVVPAAPSCRAGEVPGQVNGEAVCVGRSSGITRKLADR